VTRTFGSTYADAYDALYADKDYEAECDLIESVAEEHGRGSGTILDLGCGTGRHALILAGRGWEVTGVDLSVEMLSIARRRADEAGVSGVDLRTGDVRTVRVGRQFDVVLLMFAVLGYQLTDVDVEATLRTAAVHLKPGGVLMLDVWHGPAVESIGPTHRTKTVEHADGRITRSATGALEPTGQVCVVDYTLEWLWDDRVIRSEREQHRMRYFFGEEIVSMAKRSGLTVVASGAFPDMDRAATGLDWTAGYVLAKQS
jgi:SAM-dependent methyltransferase